MTFRTWLLSAAASRAVRTTTRVGISCRPWQGQHLVITYLRMRMQVFDRVEVNSRAVSPPLAALPSSPAVAIHGTLFYNKTRVPVGWFWGNETLDVTSASVLLAGATDATLRVVPQACPLRGCNVLPPIAADIR